MTAGRFIVQHENIRMVIFTGFSFIAITLFHIDRSILEIDRLIHRTY